AVPKLRPDRRPRQRVQQELSQGKAQPTAPVATQPGATQPGAAVPSAAPLTPAATRSAAIEASPRVRVESPSLTGSISLVGGRIDDLVLAKYREPVGPTSPNVLLFSPSLAPHPYYPQYGWVAATGTSPPMPGR